MNNPMKTKQCSPASLTLAASLLLVSGCATSQPPTKTKETPPPAAVQAADKLFQSGQYTDAMIACTDISRKDPLTPGLSDLEARIQEKLAALRKANFARNTDPSDANAVADGLRHGILPSTYGVTHSVRGETSPQQHAPLSKMQQILRQPISVQLENVDLNEIVKQINLSQDINIVTDGSLGAGTLTVRAVNTPLIEILDYIGRNLKVSFTAGENVIWVTKRDETSDSGIPFETRIYRLRKGLSGDEIVPGTVVEGATLNSRTFSIGGSGSTASQPSSNSR